MKQVLSEINQQTANVPDLLKYKRLKVESEERSKCPGETESHKNIAGIKIEPVESRKLEYYLNLIIQ